MEQPNKLKRLEENSKEWLELKEEAKRFWENQIKNNPKVREQLKRASVGGRIELFGQNETVYS